LLRSGALWSSVASPAPAGTSLVAVSGSSPTDVWAAGSAGTLLHYDGTWVVVPSGTSDDVTDIWVADAQHVVATTVVGDILWSRNGASWARAQTGTGTALRAISGQISGGSIWVNAVGDDGLHGSGTLGSLQLDKSPLLGPAARVFAV